MAESITLTLTDDDLWRIGAALRLYAKEKAMQANECPSQTRAACNLEDSQETAALYSRLRPAIRRGEGATVTA